MIQEPQPVTITDVQTVLEDTDSPSMQRERKLRRDAIMILIGPFDMYKITKATRKMVWATCNLFVAMIRISWWWYGIPLFGAVAGRYIS